MATVKLILNKSRTTQSGVFPLVLQVIQQRKKKLVYTGYRIDARQFDTARGKVVRHKEFVLSNYNIGKINKSIEQMHYRLKVVISMFEFRGLPYTVNQIIGQYHLEQENRKDLFLFTYFDERIRLKQELGKVGIMAAYQSTRASIERYWGRVDLRLSEITPQFVRGYREFLLLSKVSTNTIAYYMRNFRTIYKYALEQSGNKSSDDDPFKNTGTQPSKTVKRALKRDVLMQMVNADLSKRPSVDLSRDLFLFSFYTRGMALVDIIHLTKENLSDGVLTYQRRKTGQTLSILLTPQLRELITKYDSSSRYLFSFMTDDTPEKMYTQYRLSLRRINNGLKMLAKDLSIDHPLTTYVARHSWATQAKECGASISIISEGLGHTSEKTTAIYLKQFDRSVLDQMNEIVTKLK